MMRAIPTGLALFAALTLSGCLLPQPDTPIIPPLKPDSGRGSTPIGAPAQPTTRTQPEQAAQPAMAPVSEQPSGMLAPAAPGVATGAAADNAKESAGAPGRLEGTLEGLTALRVTAVPVAEGPAVEAEVAPDGTFSLTLAPGEYWLDFTLGQPDRPVRLDTRLRVEPGETRKLVFTLANAPLRATIEEEVPLIDPAATPEASTASRPAP